MPTPTPTLAGDPTLVAIGGAVRALRKDKGISQESLALTTGIERSYLSGIERGAQNVTVMKLALLASALDVKLVDLMRRAHV